MPSLKSLRGRIKSVKNTRQITSTMKMVAAAKLRRARDAAEKARPYADRLLGVLNNLAAQSDSASAPLLLQGRPNPKKVRIVVFGSDRGLCGAFNGSILKAAFEAMRRFEAEGKTVEFVAVGNKACDGLDAKELSKVVKAYRDGTKDQSFNAANTIGTELVDAFMQGACDEVYIVYNKFISALTQQPKLTRLVPFTADASAAPKGVQASMEYEPSEEAVLADLLPRNLAVQVFQAMLESNASEQGARMTAMDNATRNAKQMIQKLTLKYNRTRQATITSELIEIISGAEAIAG